MTDPGSSDLTRFERIRDLSSISSDIPRLLQSAGLAVSALTNRPLPDSSDPDQQLPKHILNAFDKPPGASSPSDSPSLSAHKEAFRDASASYYTLLQSVSARLRRQAWALEEAGLISESADKYSEAASSLASGIAGAGGAAQALGMQDDGKQTARVSAGIVGQPAQDVGREAPVTNGGLGNLDVGWLNSRGEGVERGKEGELMEEARSLLEKVVARMEGREVVEGNAMEGVEQA
ncbi:MAG: hypothetical protein Q9165_001474 [Trypethelium subeluteriae]